MRDIYEFLFRKELIFYMCFSASRARNIGIVWPLEFLLAYRIAGNY